MTNRNKSLLPLLLRVSVALVWLHEGLWMKVVHRDPHELSIVTAVGTPFGLSTVQFLAVIGIGEVLIAFAVLIGILRRPIAWLQIALILAMNLTAIFGGHGVISEPVGLLIHNLPLLLCIWLAGYMTTDRPTVSVPSVRP